MNSLNGVNGIISGIVVAIGVYLKNDLKDKKIGNFKLMRLFPLIILIVSEILHITYGFTQGEDTIISISNGLTSAMLATFGYDVVKSMSKGD